jgi:uncharacterized protein
VDNGLEVLNAEDSFELIGGGTIGRIAVSVGALPALIPVQYVVDDGDILIQLDDGFGCRIADGCVLGFEVDQFDAARRSGWSVLIIGTAKSLDAAEVEAATGEPLPHRDDHPHCKYMRLHPGTVTGRRISRPTGRRVSLPTTTAEPADPWTD